jgi:NitT/TauT family transport system permease protein
VILRRGLVPYIVISQTIPILAIAPMVVVGLGTKGVTPWVSVAVIAAYLTFFPVAMNTLRGLLSAQPRDLELMRSYAADRRSVLWKLRFPTSLPFIFSALKISATA